jgi:endonuclease YncB( thermonuclease family)
MGNCLCADSDTPIPNVDFITDVSIYHSCTCENTPSVSYENIRKKVKVLRVVDGDTVDIAMISDDTKKIFKYRIRMYGIDTPEKKPLKTNPDREKEIEAAKKSSQALRQKMEENGHLVTILLYKPDKYGRLLGTLYDAKGEDINQWMVQHGFATPYFGKTKKSFAGSSVDDIYYIDD